MKALTFVIVTLLSGAIAGIILGLINQAIVEPFIDKAIGIETQRHIDRGESVNAAKQSQYRTWQKGGEVVAAATYGISLSALFGIVFSFSRRSLPGFNNKRKALLLACIMFFVIFLIPALKYPANPPAVGNPATIYYREMLYVGFIAVSGFSVLALAISYRRLQIYFPEKPTWLIISLIYTIIMISAYVVFPPNPDKVTIPSNLITSFRIASVSTIGIFWGVLGMIVGLFWDKLKIHETNRVASSSSDAFVS
ncbi:MAG TPA: CbtA family protein [Nitrososphaeraceae archaeon]|nr:CbtA family protein [Nitrososphaeraceae archaeon]